MRKIFKYSISIDALSKIQMHKDAEILRTARYHESNSQQIKIWAIVNPDAELEEVTIRIHGTGHLMSDDEALQYIDTVFVNRLVFHVFKVLW